MKKVLFLLALLPLLAGCDDVPSYIKECPKGDVYKKHSYDYTNLYRNDGYLAQRCEFCGLERRALLGLEYPKHFGGVYVYKDIKSGNFSNYYVNYVDDEGEHFIKVKESDLIIRKKR